MKIIDFHTHAFPDYLAERAIPVLEEEADIKAVLDGKLSTQLSDMERNGVTAAVLASIATKPEQFPSIMSWSKSIASSRIYPFPSVHPDDPAARDRIRVLKREGMKGIKLHPYYQRFVLDEEKMFPLYEEICETGLLVLCHTGFDIAFERKRVADPVRIIKVLDRFPDLKLVTSHFGAWEDWDEVMKYLLGKPVYMDISYSGGYIAKETAGRILEEHPAEYLLYGTDSPWGSHTGTLDFLSGFGLDEERQSAILFRNAARLLGIKS